MRPASVLILMYHRLGDRPIGLPEDDVYRVTPVAFEAQMALLARKGHPVLPASALDGGAIPDRGVVLTFDDGCDSDFGVALPILRSHGFPASFFVSPELLGREGYLSWGDLAQISAAGMEIGSHGLDHALLGEVQPREAERQLRESRALLERHLDRRVESVALPGGSGGRGVARLALAAGYRRVLGSRPGLATGGGGAALLPRFAVRRADDLSAFEALVGRRPSARIRHWARYRVLASARQLLGAALYEAIKGRLLDRTRHGPRHEPAGG